MKNTLILKCEKVHAEYMGKGYEIFTLRRNAAREDITTGSNA